MVVSIDLGAEDVAGCDVRSLRHSVASLLLRQSRSVVYVARQLGC
jgi:hypothetical protein